MNNLADNSGKRSDGTVADRGGSKVYASGNWSPQCPTGCSDDWNNKFMTYEPAPGGTTKQQSLAPATKARALTPFAAPAVTTDPTNKLRDKVLATVGASKPKRDAVDTRIINDVIDRTGGYSLTTQFAGGPWPDLATGAPNPPADTDHDGMPDSWETAHGFNPNSATDGPQDKDGDGYTNIEEYLNELAGDPGATSISLVPKDGAISSALSAMSIGSGEFHISWIGGPNASVTVYTLAGKKVALISHTGITGAIWDAKRFPAGVYLVRVKAGNAVQTAKVFYVK